MHQPSKSCRSTAQRIIIRNTEFHFWCFSQFVYYLTLLRRISFASESVWFIYPSPIHQRVDQQFLDDELFVCVSVYVQHLFIVILFSEDRIPALLCANLPRFSERCYISTNYWCHHALFFSPAIAPPCYLRILLPLPEVVAARHS